MSLDDRYWVSGRSASNSPGPWWLVPIAFWRTLPIVIALLVGYAIGHPTLGALIGLAFLLSNFAFSRWLRANPARQGDDGLPQAFALYFAAEAALLVLAVIGWVLIEQS